MIDLLQEMISGRRMTIGMVHTLPLPGSYDDRFSMQEIVDRAVADAQVLERTGFDALVVENQNDGPLTDDAMDAQRIAALTYVCSRVMDSVSIPVGIDACGDQIAAIAIASVVGASFVRLSYMVDVRVSARGIVLPNGARAAMYRKRIGADDVKIFADIQVKHSFPLVREITLEDSARWAVSSRADALIVTGAQTGVSAQISDFVRVRTAVSIPVVAGSGVTVKNLTDHYEACDGCIVGSALKKDGNLMNPVDEMKARDFMLAVSNWKKLSGETR